MEAQNYFKNEIPTFTNISLQFTGIGNVIIHGNGLLTYLCRSFNLNKKNLPLHTLYHSFQYLIDNMKFSGFEVIAIFFEDEEDIYMRVLIEYIKKIYKCEDITLFNNYIKNERIALVLGDITEKSQEFLYKCYKKNLYVGFMENLEIKVPFIYMFVYSPSNRKCNEELEFSVCNNDEDNSNYSLEDINHEIKKYKNDLTLEKIEKLFKSELKETYFENMNLEISEKLCKMLLGYLRNNDKLYFDGRLLFSNGTQMEEDVEIQYPRSFMLRRGLREQIPEKVELDYLVNFRSTNEKSHIIHLKNLQKSAESLFNGKLLFAPIVRNKNNAKVKVSKKQQLIIEQNEKRMKEKQKEQDNFWLKNFYTKYKNADTITKKNLLEGVYTENENIAKRILALKIEYYSDIWNLEKRSANCDERKIIPCYLNCLEYLEKYLANDAFTEFTLQKLVDCGFEATVHEIMEKNNLKFDITFYTDDTSAPSDYDICFQLKHTGDKLKRNLGSRKDSRVLFKPDAWQRRLLDIVDENKSGVVVAPTSSGKTFICFYAIEKILRNSDTDMVVFCLPTKALANQVSADIYARFALKVNVKTSIQGSLMKDYCNDPYNCQVLITIPSLLESILNDPPENILKRIKYIIIDEVHKINSEEMGSPIERIIHLSSCPLLVLSATLGNFNGFYNWMSQIEKSKNRECELIVHKERYCELKPYVYSDTIVPINNLFAYSYEHIKKFGFGNDINFLPEELLDLFDSLIKVLTKEQKELLYPLVPERFFKSNILTKKDVKDYEAHLLQYFEKLIKSNNLSEKQVKKIYKLQTRESKQAFEKLDKFDEEYILENIMNLLDDLKEKNMLPCIIFNTDRDFVNRMAVRVYEKLEALDTEIKRNRAIEKIHKEAKRNRDAVKSKDSWIEESLEAERNYDYKVDKKNIKYTYLDPVTKITDFELEEETRYIKNTKPEFIDMLYRGIGVHHEQMNRKYRNVAEILFRQKHLRVLFATDTLALGINMPCRTVVFAGDSLLLDPSNFKQMAGRAGRRGYDTLGNLVFLGFPQRRVQNLMVSLLPTIKGVYTYTNTSFVGFDIKDSLVKYPLLKNAYIKEDSLETKLENLSVEDKYDLSDIYTSEENITKLVDIQTNILNRFFNQKSYLNDLIISNRELDPAIFVFALILENNLLDFEPITLMTTVCHLFEVRPLLFESKCVLPSLDDKIYEFCKEINKMANSATQKIYNPTLRLLSKYSKHNLHNLLSFYQVPYLDTPKNSYILDFFKSSTVEAIVLNNKVRSADLFKSLNNINTMLLSLTKWYSKYEIDEVISNKLSVFYTSFKAKFESIFA